MVCCHLYHYDKHLQNAFTVVRLPSNRSCISPPRQKQSVWIHESLQSVKQVDANEGPKSQLVLYYRNVLLTQICVQLDCKKNLKYQPFIVFVIILRVNKMPLVLSTHTDCCTCNWWLLWKYIFIYNPNKVNNQSA